MLRSLAASTLLLATLVIVPSAALAQTTIMGGNVINQTWTAASGPYTVQGDITVPAGAFLVIEAGTVVRFATSDATGSGEDTSEIELRVVGRLTVNGTDAAPVTFESLGSTGQWDGIRLTAGSGATTIDGASILEAETAIRIDATPTRLAGLRISAGGYGIDVTGASSATLESSVITSSPVGVRMQSTGTLTVDHGTFYANTDGVLTYSGTTSIRSSIFSSHGDDGIDVDGGSVTISHTNSWGSAGANIEGSPTVGAGVIASNPLFVATPTNLRLTSRSPSRNSAMDGSDQGALPYVADATPGMVGTIWETTTIPAGVTDVLGDLTVAPGVTVTLAPGATLSFATSDLMRANDDSSEPELRVEGTLVVDATAASPVVLQSAGSEGQWDGLVLLPGSGGTRLRNLVIDEAETGIRIDATPTQLESITIDAGSYGVDVRNAAGATLVRAIITGSPVGVRMQSTGTLVVDHGTFYANTDGVLTYSGTTTVRSSIFSSHGDDGIDVDGGSVTISHTNSWGSAGANIEGSPTVGSGVISANPLFVATPANLRLTSRSPSRNSAMDGSDQGALPYIGDPTSGWVGTIWETTTIPAGVHNVIGDLTVALGVTLTLAPGATLSFATSDLLRAHDDTSEIELRVIGTLMVAGTSASPVVLESAGSSGQWDGVVLLPGSTTTRLRGLSILEAETGIRVDNTPTELHALTISAGSYGIDVRNGASATLTSSVITGTPVGARMQSTGSLSVINCTFHANTDGVLTYSGTTIVRNSIFTAHNDDGIDVDGGSVNVSYTNTWGSAGANIEGSPTLGAGNLSTNPFYASAPTDLRLTSGSACIDAGTATSAPSSDRDGNPRPLDGDGILGAVIDMGAYELALASVCGDGTVGAGESCDDGAMNGAYDRCNASCTGPGPRCGDMVVNGPEQCDDADADNGDACLSTCRNASCGDGFVRAGVEECDDSNAVTTDACVACNVAECGDGFVRTGVEDCDDSNTSSSDACVMCNAAVCGDGFVRTGVEQCDDGNSSSTDTCTGACTTARCGDGFVGPGETCDDGNMVDADGCSNLCRPAACGDGIVQPGEQCDDMNMVNDDACSNACRTPRCGDGIRHSGEACDDGNMVNDDACSNACESARCGDGILHTGEECDDGNVVAGDGCTTTCTTARCGDGVVRTGVELCDDANDRNDDSCVMGCTPAVCGDGYLHTGVEACDDGNLTDDDGCSSTCALASCGDGTVQTGEECDDGNLSNLDGCLSTCLGARCGDGHVRAGAEACDDGNDVDTDACLATCRNASCGDGVVHAGVEDCDDGNAEQTDECLFTCELASCGDGHVRDGVEECDDGNADSGDGCSAACVEEPMSMPDGGMPTGDGGTIEPDGGAIGIDGGAIGADAGTMTDPGGCACRAGARGRSPLAALVIAVAIGLSIGRRRRRR